MSIFRVIGLQALSVAVVAVSAGLLGGQAAAFSALLGGAVCVVPNALFALNLYWLRDKAAGLGVLLLGEFVKVSLTITLLALAVMLYQDVVWVAAIVAVIAALKAQVFAWAWH